MSTQTPVVLISCPNLPYFLGTFDTTKFRTWWKSYPLPDDVILIKKGFHIYGRTHLAIGKRMDGRWAIYRSKNYGIEWERAFLAAEGEEIYDLVLITYGRAIMNTSLGFYETVSAGTSWDLVLSVPGGAPNAPAFCNIGGGDVLMCTDGRYIWRSANIARSWTMVCDMQAVLHGQTQVGNTRYLGPSVPCIAGANGRVVAGHGPFLVRSDNGGLSFGPVAYWETDPIQSPAILRPPADLVYNRIWSYWQLPEKTISKAGYIITQILISSIDGPAGNDVVFVLKMNDLWPIRGQTELFTWTLKTWTSDPILQKNGHWKPVFQQRLTPTNDGEQLSSYEVSVLGANYSDKLIFSAQTRKDSTGKDIPSLKYSTNGGETWYDVNLSEIKSGNPGEAPVYDQSVLDENFARMTWIAPGCNNYGKYDFVELYRIQCQSYEMDALMESAERDVSIDHDIDATLLATPPVDLDVDSILEESTTINDMVDGLLEGEVSKTYRVDRTLEGVSTKDEDIDVVLEAAIDIDDSVDAHFWQNKFLRNRVDVSLRDNNFKIYMIDVYLRRDRFPERVVKIERGNPQFLDLVAPDIPYSPMDSRKEVT